MWDLRSSNPQPQEVRLFSLTQALALSPDGRRVYTTWPLTAYDVATGRTIWRRDKLTSWLTIDLNRAGTHLALQDSRNSTIPIVDARTGELRDRLRGHEEQVFDLRYSDDGTLLGSTSADEIFVWDAATGDPREHFQTSEVSFGVGFSPDNSLLYSGGEDHTLRTWDVSGEHSFLRQAFAIEDPQSYANVHASPDGRRLAYLWVDDEGEWIRFADAATGASTPRMPSAVWPGPRTLGAWHPDSRHYSFVGGEGAVTVVDAVTGSRVDKKVAKSWISSIAYIDGGKLLLVGDGSGHLTILDADTLLPRDNGFELAPRNCCASSAPDGRSAVVFEDSDDGTTETWKVVDVDTGKVLESGDLDFRAHAADYSPDGRRIAVTGNSGEVVAIDLQSGRVLRAPTTGHSDEGLWVRWSQDGSQLVSSAADGSVSLWDGATLELLGTVVPAFDSEPVPSSPSFTEGSPVVTIASYDGAAYLWDARLYPTIAFACQMAGRNFTKSEWVQAFDDRPYEKTCPQF